MGKGQYSSTAKTARRLKYRPTETGLAIAEMLKDRGVQVNKDNTVTLYHATTSNNVADILENGFRGNNSPIGGGVAIGEKIGPRSFFGLDREWTKRTWGGSNSEIIEVKVPVDYIRQGSGDDNLEVYIEGNLKPTGSSNIWIPDRKPTSTFYDRIALKMYGKQSRRR